MQNATMQPLRETTLVRLAQNGVVAAFDELVRRYRPAVFVVSRSVLKNRECAEDTVQDTFLTAFRNLRALRECDRFAPWLHAIARQQAIQRARKSWDERSALQMHLDEALLDNSPALSADPVSGILRRAELDELWSEVLRLPEDWRTPMVLHLAEGWSLAAVSEFLDLPVSTVKWRMYQARRLLRRKFGERIKDDE